MHADRDNHTATLLPAGETLVVGGGFFRTHPCDFLPSAELYDPNSGS